MKAIILILLFAILIMGVVSAENYTNNTLINKTDNLIDNNELCNYIIQKTNIPIGTKIPGVFVQYKNAKFNAYNTVNETIGHLIISHGYVTEFDCTMIDSPGYNVYLQGKSTVDEIMSAESQVDALKDKINSNEIMIKGTTTAKRINSFITKIAINIASWFV